MKAQAGTKDRYRPRFALRTLLGLITLMALGAAYMGRPTTDYFQEQRVGKRIEELGGRRAVVDRTEKDFRLRIARLFGMPKLFERITAVDLAGTAATDGDVKLLSQLKELSQLVLASTAITDSAAEDLIKFPSLENLDVSNTAVSDAFVDRLVPLRLSHLDTRRTAVTYEALRHINGASVQTRLMDCCQSGTFLDDGRGQNQVYFYVNENSDEHRFDDLVRFQCTDPNFSIYLHFYHDVCDDYWLSAVAPLPRLVSVHATYSKVSDLGLRELAAKTDLIELRISNAPLTQKCLPAIAELTKLEVLQLPTSAQPENVEWLRQQLPNLRELQFFASESVSPDPASGGN